MKLADFTRLKKMMALTFSDNDHEALASLRAANAILTKEGLSWDRVLDRTVTVVNEVEDAPPAPVHTRRDPTRYPKSREIDEMFERLLDSDLGRFEEFVLDVRDKYRQYGSLTAGQYAAIDKAYRRLERE